MIAPILHRTFAGGFALYLVSAVFTSLIGAHEKQPATVGVQSLDIARTGARLHLLLGEIVAKEGQPVLNHRWSDDGGATWSDAVRVDEDNQPAAGLHRGMDAQIAASGDDLIAVWQTAGTDSWGGGPMATALSADGGRTWTRGPNPADDGSTEGHNFIDIAADEKGVLHLVWLDTRKEKRGLRSAQSHDHGRTWSANRSVDDETCECCWNTIATSSASGTWLIYRDKSPRDMAIASLDDATTKPATVGAFQWEFPGCPHVGAGLCIAPDRSLHAVVWTGKEKQNGIYHLASTDRGQSWTSPAKLGDDTARNPDCVANSDGELAIVWNAAKDDASRVCVSTFPDGGRHWSEPLQIKDAGATATHPRIVSTGKSFRVFWTEALNGRVVWRSTAIDVPG